MKKFCLLLLLSVLAFASGAANWAEQEYLATAQKEDSEAQYNLGVCYKRGNGVTKDYEKAVYWFRKSAASGNAKAQWELGYAYATGRGVPQDFEQSVLEVNRRRNRKSLLQTLIRDRGGREKNWFLQGNACQGNSSKLQSLIAGVCRTFTGMQS
jgi:TPR repeat protein